MTLRLGCSFLTSILNADFPWQTGLALFAESCYHYHYLTWSIYLYLSVALMRLRIPSLVLGVSMRNNYSDRKRLYFSFILH
jgi:hypothetical protein